MFAGREILDVDPKALSSTIEFLTAMITPALLISATGSLVLSTSTRLGRVVDRVRALEVRVGELIYAQDKDAIPLYEKRVEVVIDLIDLVTSRSRLLQRAMTTFYYGLMFFILTSVAIAIVGIFPAVYRWLPIPIGIVGIIFLFYGSILMLKETRMATATINEEMDFVWELARKVAPKDVAARYDHKGRIKGYNGPKVSKTLGGE
ncbi:MAG: DUF2721 domain-containing protein [Acidobacteria bacterium]|nr:DUF2721 domain-containing protein [Acidobacteriota bacterium]